MGVVLLVVPHEGRAVLVGVRLFPDQLPILRTISNLYIIATEGKCFEFVVCFNRDFVFCFFFFFFFLVFCFRIFPERAVLYMFFGEKLIEELFHKIK